MSHPYKTQRKHAFWKNVVSEKHPLEINGWYSPKFSLHNSKIGSGGSCFAQHIGNRLKTSGFRYVDVEPSPPFFPESIRKSYGYEIYSARYGNIYTTTQLLQLAKRAYKLDYAFDEHIWHKESGYVDGFRPTIEAVPHVDEREMLDCRDAHLRCVGNLFDQLDVFIFTLGLTEVWISRSDGAAFPICPGTSGGRFDPELHCFKNLSYLECVSDLEEFFDIVRSRNPSLKFILTVSPVPLVATATSNQVVVASSYSKSVLRAAAGYFSDRYDWIDYFPSYEIIASNPMRSMFYNGDMRSVASAGVDHVMNTFFSAHPKPRVEGSSKPPLEKSTSEDDIRCDEELLSAFGQ